MKVVALASAFVLSISSMLVAQEFSSVPGQGRSMVVTKFGIVAAPQFLASQAGAHILEQGGNAIDAAIAANAVMAWSNLMSTEWVATCSWCITRRRPASSTA